MTQVVLDVVLVLPERIRRHAIACSDLLSERMEADGSPACFRLGKPFPGAGGGLVSSGECEPHVSLFMLTVGEDEVDEVVFDVEKLAKTLPAVHAEGAEYRHNPYGALEVHFTRSAAWRALQRAVVTSVEPRRRGRLREVDPSGTRIRDLIDNALQDESRRHQLLTYGYDEIADESDGGQDRFRPHVTLAWPQDPDSRVDLQGLPHPDVFSGVLTGLAVFGMSPYGTCTRDYGVFSLDTAGPDPVAHTGRHRKSAGG